MKKLFTSFFMVLVFLLFYSSPYAQQQEVVEKYSKVRITIHDRTDLKKLQIAGLSLEGMQIEENLLELILSEREIIRLREIGFSYETLIDDMTKFYQERSRRTETEMRKLEKEMKEKYISGGFGFGSMGGFYTYDEVVAELDTMRMLYPNLITAKYSIGASIEGRTIWAVKISDNPDVQEGEPEVFFNSLIHAREPAGMMAVIYFMYHLLENYGSDPEVTYLVDNRELYFVPVINPDGYEYNRSISPSGGGMWRKNRRDNGGGIFGVDPARNFSYMWGYDNIGSSPDPASDMYRGTAAFSEPECQVMRDFFYSRDIKIVNNFHAYWNVIFTPWGYNMTLTPDSTIFNSTIDLATQLNGYKNGFYIPDWYLVNGYPCDWIYGEQTTKPKIFSFLTEVGNNNDGFWPIPDRIFPLASENCYLNKIFAWAPGVIDDPPHITEGSLYSSYCAPSVDSIRITAVETNPENNNSVVTAYLYDINDNLIDEFEMSEISANTFYASHPAPQEENFYYLLLKDEGVEIPSTFYYKKNLKFTTAGPLKLDSVAYAKYPNFYNVRPFIRNDGNTLTITNAKLRLYCDDPWVTSVTALVVSLSPIAPGATVGGNTWIAVNYDPATFPGYFNLRAEISRDGFIYWIDSTQLIVTGVEDGELQPLTYNLEQNYPNPFNPSTVISYQLPVGGNVSLKVFDVLGNEVVTLVAEYKPAGRYEVVFNAASLPSGVYFYQLKAGDYVDTKKMLLIK
jgi:hypothetical protein